MGVRGPLNRLATPLQDIVFLTINEQGPRLRIAANPAGAVRVPP
jgi:hypothetical protein